MSTEYTVGNYLMDRLSELGIKHLFGVPGDFAFPFLDRLEENQNITWVGNCSELNASYAADGYARIHGIGAFAVTGGVGELLASCGVGGANAELVPVIAITGHPSTRERQRVTHHSLRGNYDAFTTIYKELTVAQAVLTTEQNACQEIDRVLQTCWLEKLPVYIQMAKDVQAMPAQPPTEKLVLPEYTSDQAQLKDFLDHLLPMLNSASRPAIIADVLVGRYHLTDLLQSFAEKSGIPFAATYGAKSAFINETHPQYLGTYVADIKGDYVSQQINEADLLFRLCVQRSETNVGHAAFDFEGPQVVTIQAKGASIGTTQYPEVALRDVLTQLSSQVSHRQFDFLSLKARTDVQPFEPKGAKRLTQERFWQRFSQFLREDDILVADEGTVSACIVPMLPAGVRVAKQTTWAAIGYSLPALVGACIADPHSRHIHLIGDGAFQETAQELSTLLRHGLAPIMFVINNATYVIENLFRVGNYENMGYNVLQPWSYHQLPQVFNEGQKSLGLRVTTEEELEQALTQAEQAQAAGNLVLIEVVLGSQDYPQAIVTSNAELGGTSVTGLIPPAS